MCSVSSAKRNTDAIAAIFFDSFYQICYYFTIFSTFVILILKIAQILEVKKMKNDQKQVTPLSPEQMHQWENDGYLLLKGVVSEAAINGVRDSFARVVDGIIRELKAGGIIEDVGSELHLKRGSRKSLVNMPTASVVLGVTKWRLLKFSIYTTPVPSWTQSDNSQVQT